jgi:hypothetical protein
MKVIRWSLLALLTGSLACSSDSTPIGSGADNGHAGDGDGDNGPGDADNGGNDDPGDDDDGDDDGDTGDGDGDGEGDGCQEFSVFAKPTTPDMLIVLDRSTSMNERPRMDTVSRWNASSKAVIDLTAELDDVVHFGLMVFPAIGKQGDPTQCFEPCSDDPFGKECSDCLDENSGIGDDLVCGPGKIDVPIGPNTASKIADVINSTDAQGGTPTGGSLQEAAKSIGSTMAGPDEESVPKYVVLVTDGQPTCPNAGGTNQTGGATAGELKADNDLTLDAIKALKAAGVKTYVVGYNVSEFADAMDEFASTGGTDHYRAVENSGDLVMEFKEIAGEVVSCTFVLDQEPPDPQKVEVKVDGTQVYLNDKAGKGFTLDGKNITLQDVACQGLQDGGKHQVDVKVTCEVIVPPVM